MQSLQISLKALGLPDDTAPACDSGVVTLTLNSSVLINFTQDDAAEHVVAFSSPGQLPQGVSLEDIQPAPGSELMEVEESARRSVMTVGDERSVVLVRTWPRAELDARSLFVSLASVAAESQAWAGVLSESATSNGAAS